MKKEWIFVSLIMSIVFATSPTWADSPAQKDGAVALPSIHFERLGDSTISAEAVSRDGLTVAGEGSSVFRWKKYEGLEFLDFDGRPQGISDDGSVIVGSIGARLFRWSESGGFENLGTIGWGEYADVSADGSVISAIITNPIGFNEAIRLDPDGITGLGYIRNDDYIMNWSKASGISADGSVIVGFGNGGGMAEAWRWTKSGGIQGLGGLGRSAYNGHAFDVSTDGSIIVGDESDQAFIWTEDTGMTGLGKISESRRERSCASAVSADGSVVVGLSWGFSGYEAFIWEEEIGMLSLNEVLCDNGFDLDGFMLVRANGVSDDGRTIAGKGVNKERGPEGWVLVLPERGALTGLEISGPTEISENSIAVYKALAKFENGYSLNVASTAVWSVDALNDMEIEKNGLLNTESVDKPQQMTISASWAIDEVTVEAELTVEFDWYVPETLQVPGEFETIQDAINASQNRDIVLVADGTYTGNGNHNIEVGDKVITVRSENGPENCIIDCEGSGEDGRCGFIFRGRENNDCTVDGFTITNGDNGGIVCQTGSNATITNCIIKGNSFFGSPPITIASILPTPVLTPIPKPISDLKSILTGQRESLLTGYLGPIPIDRPPLIKLEEWIGGSGGIYCNYANVLITNCVIQDNFVSGINGKVSGSGIYSRVSTLIIRNCIVANNICTQGQHWNEDRFGGGGMFFENSDVTIVNSTITDNSTDGDGGAIYCCSSDIIMRNSILWGNEARFGPSVAMSTNSGNGPSLLFVSYSDIQGGNDVISVGENCTLEWANGNMDIDPLFDDASNNDYHLQLWSACIDAGDNSVVEPNSTDLDGNGRITNGVVDMGAYEALGPIEADVRIVPQVINRNNHLRRVIAIMRLPEGIGRRDVADEPFVLYVGDSDTDGIEASWDRVIGWGNMTRVFALFDKGELMDAVPNNGRVELELIVVGQLESGQYIYGSDTVRIVQPRRRRARWQRRR